HTWNDEQFQPRNVWLTCYSGINNANRVIDQIESGNLPIEGENKENLISEMRAVRALYYSILVDTHGNVPIIKDIETETQDQNTRKEVYDFIVSELKDVVEDLPENVDKSTYGRLTKWGAYSILARVYLNAEVYIGESHWKDCIEICNKII